jgi:hypothetical protein
VFRAHKKEECIMGEVHRGVVFQSKNYKDETKFESLKQEIIKFLSLFHQIKWVCP